MISTAASEVLFNHQTKIINIGHLPGHTIGKVNTLNAAGFVNASSIVTLESTPEAIKEELRNSPYSLFIVGGAMIQTYPDLMNELFDFIKSECPTMKVHNTTVADFPPDLVGKPTEEIVTASAVTICNRYLGTPF